MKLKLLSIMFILLGAGVTGYAGWGIVKSKVQADVSIEKAKEVVAKAAEPKRDERFAPATGEVVGLLKIPDINSELAIIEGTDPDELEKGVGHYKGSYYPGENGQIVLSGHRDTVFRSLGELELGDELTMKMPFGEHTYNIVETKIVEADDLSIITLQNEEEELIVTTCYPFSYIGNAPQRYIIYAKKAADKN